MSNSLPDVYLILDERAGGVDTRNVVVRGGVDPLLVLMWLNLIGEATTVLLLMKIEKHNTFNYTMKNSSIFRQTKQYFKYQ